MPGTHYQPNYKPGIIYLSFQIKKDQEDKKDNYFPIKPMDNSNHKYMDKSMDNILRYLDTPDIFIQNNLCNKYNLIVFGILISIIKSCILLMVYVGPDLSHLSMFSQFSSVISFVYKKMVFLLFVQLYISLRLKVYKSYFGKIKTYIYISNSIYVIL